MQNLILSGVFALVALVAGFKALLRLIQVIRTATAGVTPIADLVAKRGTVSGRVLTPEATLTSPLQGSSCVHYRLSVSEVVRQTTHVREGETYDPMLHAPRDGQRTLASERDGVEFLLEDASARARVDGETLSAWVRPSVSHGPLPGHALPAEVIETLRRRFGERANEWVAEDLPLRVVVSEVVVCPGDEVYLDGALDRSDEPPRVVPVRETLRLSDTPPNAGVGALIPGLIWNVMVAAACGGIALVGFNAAAKRF